MTIREKISSNGKIWVKKPSLNYRQTSGVEFRGVYMTLTEYKAYLYQKALNEKTKKDEENGQ